jgi:cytochrome b subunit of formate dehydrogenase
MSKKVKMYVITIADWQRVLKIMRKYSRIEGYVDVVEYDEGMRLAFFDGNPNLRGVGACKVTIADVVLYRDTMLEQLN